jgi:hypothetical protein
MLLLLLASALVWLFRIPFLDGITWYIYRVDPLRPSSHIIVENWEGSIDMFERTRRVCDILDAKDSYSIIEEDAFNDIRKRHVYILDAYAAGIDTTRFFLIPFIKQDPKTLHIAQAVLDTAHARGWKEITIITADLHSARSRKAYLRAARPYGIDVTVIGGPLEDVTSENWTATSSGVTMAFEEVVKKIYYDIFVF